MPIPIRLKSLVLLTFWLVLASRAAEVEVETVLEDLQNPCGVAIQPETEHVFVSDSGAGRILRVVDGDVETVISGFGKDTYGADPAYEIGPLGLVFLDQKTLVVGGGDLPNGEEQVRVFQVPPAGSEPLKVDAATAGLRLAAGEGFPGEGNFFGLAADRRAVFVTSIGDDSKGWVSRASRNNGGLASLERFIATKEATGVNAPRSVTISPRREIVVGQMGELDTPGDSLLTFYHADNGRMLLNLETGLHDITAVVYSPDGQLYATDFAWKKNDEGGLFQLVATLAGGKQRVESRRILALDKPTAMTFAKDGSLLVTVFGSTEPGSDRKPGKLLKIAL